MYVKQMAPSKIVGNMSRAALVGATGAVLSVLVLNGMSGVPVVGGVMLPKFAVHGLVLGASSIAASYAVPALTPFVSAGSPQLKRFQTLVVEPLVLGTISLAVESILAPEAQLVGQYGTVRTILVGGAASVLASYTSDGMGWSASVI